MIARVAVDISLDRLFDYAVPEELASRVAVGWRVSVPFGRREVQGYIIELVISGEFEGKLKPIGGLLGELPLLDESLVGLARWMSGYYLAPLEACVRTLLPGAVRTGKGHRTQRFVRFCGPSRKLVHPAPRRKFVPGVQSVEEGGVVLKDDTEDAAARAARHTEERKAWWERTARRVCEAASNEKRLTAAQETVVDTLVRYPNGVTVRELLSLTKGSESPVKTLAARGVVEITEDVTERDPLAGSTVLPSLPLVLNPDQAKSLAAINASIDSGSGGVYLLHGVTGSGKTEVYLQAIARAVERGMGAICLVPEISLTPQTVERFTARFGRGVAVLHSNLSDGERHDQWYAIRRGDARIVVGARSALFSPVKDLGLIVVDEEHEPSYKQGEAPRYSARDVAVMRGHMLGVPVVLGTATPSLESWENAVSGKYHLLDLPVRADNRSLPRMHVVDMRLEAEKTGKMQVFSGFLIKRMEERLSRGEQVILFLNRRGYSTALMCKSCGHVSECESCSVAHTYHRSDERLRCHICGNNLAVPSRCPECGDPDIKYSGLGTQRVEAVLKHFFPKAKVARMDADTTVRKSSYADILGAFRSGLVDVLIGTQMIAKGLHFPGVTLVGVINADTGLHIADFRAGERTFQLLSQVAGRAGRGELEGDVVVQTCTPHHPAVEAAKACDYEGWAGEELDQRRELGYPPFGKLMCIWCWGRDELQVRGQAERISVGLQAQCGDSVRVSDACPAPLAKAKRDWRYQVIVRGPSSDALNAMGRLVNRVKFPAAVHVAVDVDALSIG